MILAEDVTIRRGVQRVVEHLDWRVERGECWLLLGLNGCGKTSLLSALAGFAPITGGRITIDGAAYDERHKQALHQRVGFVSSSFFDQCFSRENVCDIVLSGFTGRLSLARAMDAQEAARAKALMAAFGLNRKWPYPYDVLSKGQRQKVLIARALVNAPDILLLDEPCEGLDILGQLQFAAMLQEWWNQGGKTVVYVTHHWQESALCFTHAALLKDGAFRARGPIRDVLNSVSLSAFLQRPVRVTWQGERFMLTMDDERKPGVENE